MIFEYNRRNHKTMTPTDLPQLETLSKEQLIKLLWEMVARVQALEAEAAVLRAENQELRARLAKNSRNSGKPPSSDGLKSLGGRKVYGSQGRRSVEASKGMRVTPW